MLRLILMRDKLLKRNRAASFRRALRLTRCSQGAMDFPLPFPFQRVLSQDLPSSWASSSFIVGAMVTPDYASQGLRLAESCTRFGLPHEVYEVPIVHHSISPRELPTRDSQKRTSSASCWSVIGNPSCTLMATAISPRTRLVSTI